MLTTTEAQNELKTAVQLNSGKWEQHSISVAENARLIAEKIDYLDSDKAYTMGLLHDIGRRAGVTGIKHIFDGYDYMMSLGETEIARICLTHSFPLKNINTFSGKYDCSDEQLVFLQEFLNSVEYNDYDILIQLCDAISLPDGACIVEKRFVDVAIRNGLTEHTIDKWKAFIKAKKHFDKLCGCNIYSLLPNVLENSTIDLI
ncbi:MAG: HD domain-containing protein [Clostridia bacterium]|nr:HD domain-containing protein [Clostridia bacterium]MEE1126295.1 HD domain-containing protein [Acutalibacteraceae bacterium]